MRDETPLPGFYFDVELGGSSVAFAEVVGLGDSRRVTAYRNGDEASPRLLATPVAPGQVTLRRGVTTSGELHEWFRSNERRDVSVSLLDADGQPARRWRLRRCLPVALAGPRLASLANEVAIEALVLQPTSVEVELIDAARAQGAPCGDLG